MSVYVDTLTDYGWRLGPSCHMYADTLEELHVMAQRLGMKRRWFQNDPRLPHYDLVATRRAIAIQFGAKEVSWREMWEHMKTRSAAVNANKSANKSFRPPKNPRKVRV